jgi:farnesyl-diphosphate farnesyltransferase
MCCAHVFRDGEVDTAELVQQGVRFGKGLQLVNILRDLPKDLRQGRCYIPHDGLDGVSLGASDLVKPETIDAFRPLYDSLLDRANDHLRAGWAYTCATPRRCSRLRLACAWPILIGVQTLDALRSRNPLDASQRVKVSRGDVYRILLRTVAALPFERQWTSLGPEPAQVQLVSRT